MNFVALRMLTGDRAKYVGLIFAIAFSTFLLENQSSIFAGILKRTTSQILDVTDADIWVMDKKTLYIDEVKALTDNDLYRVRGVPGVLWAVRLFKGQPRAKALDGTFRVVIMLGVDDASLVGAPARDKMPPLTAAVIRLPPPSGGQLAACKATQLALWRGWGVAPSGAG
jgi:putative ABC transport system permease protein